MIAHSMALIAEHTDQHCDGYLAPALSHSDATIDLFAEAGGTYTCDLFHDDQPTPVKTRSGKRFVSVPYGRMQLVDINRGPLDRALGLSELKFVTAAAATGVVIPGLPEADAETLRDELVALAESRRAGL